MRVDFTNLGFEPPQKTKAGSARNGTVPSTASNAGNVSGSAGSSGADQASISLTPARIQSLSSQALAAPEVRQEKVEPLQQAVANGSYTVDSSKVADAISGELGAGTVR